MAYGMSVDNSSGRTQFTTEENYSLAYAGSSGTATAGQAFPVSGWSGTDFIIARPASTATGSQGTGGYANVGRFYTGNWGPANVAFPSGGNGNGGGYVVWRELIAQSAASLTPSGYGLVAYGSGGTSASDIIFSATDLDVTAELVGTGIFNGTSGSGTNSDPYHQLFTMDASLDQGRYYVLVTNTLQQRIAGGMMMNTGIHIDYEFRYDTTPGTILVQSFLNVSGAGGSMTSINHGTEWAVFYVRNGGTVDSNFS